MLHMETLVCGEVVVKRPHNYMVVVWKIRYSLVTSFERNYSWTGPRFKFLNELWYLQFYVDERGWIGLRLMRADYSREPELSVCLTLGFKASDGTLHKSKRVTHSFTQSNCNQFEWVGIMQRGEFIRMSSKLYPTGMVIIHCDLSLNEKCQADAELQTYGNNAATLTKNLSDLYLKQQLCDVTINVDGRKFKAHRSILAARSTVFAAMFENDMKEKKSGVIEIDDCDPDAFHDFLLYLYTAKVEIISAKNVIALYCIPEKYDLPELTSWCEQFLLTNLSVELFCDVLVLAMNYNISTLIEAAENFFAKYAEEILVTVKWQHFMKKNSITANELFIKCVQTLKHGR